MPQVLSLCLRLLLVLLEDFPLFVIQLSLAFGEDFITDELVKVLVRIFQLPMLRNFKFSDNYRVKDGMGVLQLLAWRQLIFLGGREGVVEGLDVVPVAL